MKFVLNYYYVKEIKLYTIASSSWQIYSNFRCWCHS